MKSTPILFTGPMVRAILEGRKTQTRRIVKPQPSAHWTPEVCRYHPALINKAGEEYPGEEVFGASDDYEGRVCPFGQPGDSLWVRETFRLYDSQSECPCYDECRCASNHGKPVFRAGLPDDEGPWKPSIFMPRALSRITLEITGIRVERLQEITERDCKAEGCHGEFFHDGTMTLSPMGEYRRLWESINGNGSWNANPWVWVVNFNRINQP